MSGARGRIWLRAAPAAALQAVLPWACVSHPLQLRALCAAGVLAVVGAAWLHLLFASECCSALAAQRSRLRRGAVCGWLQYCHCRLASHVTAGLAESAQVELCMPSRSSPGSSVRNWIGYLAWCSDLPMP